jgi:hypothetical protein
MSETTCLWQLQFKTVFYIIIVLLDSKKVEILGEQSMKRYFLLAVLITILGVSSVNADWPQYLGPNKNAASGEKNLLRSWPAKGPKVLWTLELGPGYGGAAVTKGNVYLLDRIYGKQDVFRCIGLNSGKEIWSFAYDALGKWSSGRIVMERSASSITINSVA